MKFENHSDCKYGKHGDLGHVSVRLFADGDDESRGKFDMWGFSAVGIAAELDDGGAEWDFAYVYEFESALVDGACIGVIHK